MKCKNCGIINDPDAIYCGNCGELVLEDKRICYNCKTPVDLKEDHCTVCKTFIRKGYTECKKCGKIYSDEFSYCSQCKTKRVKSDLYIIKRLAIIVSVYFVLNILTFISTYIRRNVELSGIVNDARVYKNFLVSIHSNEFKSSFILGSVLNFAWIGIIIGLLVFIYLIASKNEMKSMTKLHRNIFKTLYVMLISSIIGFYILILLLFERGYRIGYIDGSYSKSYWHMNFIEWITLIGVGLLGIGLSLWFIIRIIINAIKK